MEVPSATPVTMPRFEEQQEAAEVVYVGTLVGLSLVTWHRTEVSGQPRDYLLVLGHLMQVSKDLRAGARVQAGRVIGAVGQSGTTRPGLHLEVRQVRRGIDVKQLQAVKLLDPSKTVATDPRNALALRQ
jgi:murein DD-endopeptidase MepM/ murein hydrolase activator NlpD